MSNTTMQTSNELSFSKLPFHGMELDVLIGHPEHPVLFIATQVARAAGLANPSQQVSRHAGYAGLAGAMHLGSIQNVETLPKLPNMQPRSWLFTEAAAYQMLLRGHAPASEPFRKWVTEEVLPTIRKTGRFDLSESHSEGSAQFQEFRWKIEQVLEDQSMTIATQAKELTSQALELAELQDLTEMIAAL
ncbi:BRO-N domain-containing protein [Pseudomonas sp.]|uniref:BRO-N domain-containing protein n=1 Tax=Pseudomonas sp. TaxID=306 RepID=UPI003FD82481